MDIRNVINIETIRKLMPYFGDIILTSLTSAFDVFILEYTNDYELYTASKKYFSNVNEKNITGSTAKMCYLVDFLTEKLLKGIDDLSTKILLDIYASDLSLFGRVFGDLMMDLTEVWLTKYSPEVINMNNVEDIIKSMLNDIRLKIKTFNNGDILRIAKKVSVEASRFLKQVSFNKVTTNTAVDKVIKKSSGIDNQDSNINNIIKRIGTVSNKVNDIIANNKTKDIKNDSKNIDDSKVNGKQKDKESNNSFDDEL